MVDAVELALSRLVDSDLYKECLRWHIDRGCKIVPLDPKLAIGLEMQALAATGCTVSQLLETLTAQPEVFNAFVAAKLTELEGDTAEDYPAGEKPPREERAKVLATVGFPATFLIGHLAEFTLLKLKPDDFPAYAQRYRLPKAKKYAK